VGKLFGKKRAMWVTGDLYRLVAGHKRRIGAGKRSCQELPTVVYNTRFKETGVTGIRHMP